jgi:hypothetical protein
MKNPTKTLLATLAVAFLVCAVVSPQAQGVMISGDISMGGTYTTDTGNLNTANAFTSFSLVFVISVSGDYASVPMFTSVTQNAFGFDPFVGTVSPLWTFMSGVNTYSFDLVTLSIDQQGSNTLKLSGTGDLNITGFDTTTGSWEFNADQGGGTFSFSSSNATVPAAVPEGGSAVALLSLALFAVEILRRKLAVA